MTDRAFIIASGPSLTAADCELVRESILRGINRRVFVVNDAYRLVPFANVLYACDPDWWGVHDKKTRDIPARWTADDTSAKKFNLLHIPGKHHEAARTYFVSDRECIVYGGNSGFQAINLAYVLGVRDAILLGYDMGYEKGTPSHFFGEHPSPMQKASPFKDWIEHFNRAAPVIAAAGMKVVNASRKTNLTCFPRIALEDCL